MRAELGSRIPYGRIPYIVVHSRHNDGAYHQQPIGKRNVNLAMEDL